ncbi:LysR family transcriptional regulator [Cupriavidus taiwanensis]|uniref:Transcriptional regulatory protein, LysR family n=2 Tax=Cupriavidus taiwanensis TaxID=164546 RepID=B3RAH7_CUPTR|nr:LysR family transcriptional regulator [Cupriavidus taiwanensis]CAQ71902.1 putative transcriptional regulatory protein, LysR family [Cupriavidus taiwanensis LMG 19424]SOY59728.1 putative transcriptional regulatory protein, LysR family [Cupriavidus taiwanensis]SOZ10651.1 putative transcriptional regulatory protein, LysR family [Cupriavidus taiwanensis]SOZ12833.1 putative transcriptional regulatory protein, LysR family [Cupriavidus taiwanensis]SOZ41328.1 putative transcriptional regulatory pro
MLDIRQLHYFVAVAEEEHVGRAAERLHISQSPLSRQIAQLEEKLGLVLFERSQQRIRLTRDGRTFLAETRAFLTHGTRLESLARRLGRGDEGGLCIGYLEYAMHSGILPGALRELRQDRPAVHIALYNQQSAVQLEGLRQRSLDIALVCEPPLPDDADLEAAQVLNDPMLLALPEGHPLAAAQSLTPADLGAQKWIGVMHQETALRHDAFIAACARAGFTPTITMEATEPLAALGLVAAGLGVTTIQRSLRHQAPAGVVLHELSWLDYRIPLWAAWHRVNLRPLVEIFRKTLLQTSMMATAHAAAQAA